VGYGSGTSFMFAAHQMALLKKFISLGTLHTENLSTGAHEIQIYYEVSFWRLPMI
jgi:hypothetical protein